MGGIPAVREPRFFIPEEGALRCTLCPHHCRLEGGKSGICRVRRARSPLPEEGARAPPGAPAPQLPRYGYVTALANDPVEKKPLYHWRPGTMILSAGFTGCNLRCPFCQNWRISQTADAPGRTLSPEALIAAAGEAGSEALAYTYSEPLVHAEFLLDAMTLARKEGIANVLVTNGCVNADAARAILSLADAANVDLKSFSETNYAKVLGGDLSAVLDFIRTAVGLKVHTEITTLVVPGLNDGEKELRDMAGFIEGLGDTVPWHLSACHPDWKWDAPPTGAEQLFAAAERAHKTLPYVYSGNIAGEQNDTRCLHCGSVLISRRGYLVDTGGLQWRGTKAADGGPQKPSGFCARCGKAAPVRW
ncbi:MAG: AmmeMemoRadiSam system radical SAM enzyme [Treponema sp.]|jgi:pyruvate formate lyase activating enzyme|nr:AmmeMemoRadiSam system radical SAM enzyme [Treponema sp.]